MTIDVGNNPYRNGPVNKEQPKSSTRRKVIFGALLMGSVGLGIVRNKDISESSGVVRNYCRTKHEEYKTWRRAQILIEEKRVVDVTAAIGNARNMIEDVNVVYCENEFKSVTYNFKDGRTVEIGVGSNTFLRFRDVNIKPFIEQYSNGQGILYMAFCAMRSRDIVDVTIQVQLPVRNARETCGR